MSVPRPLIRPLFDGPLDIVGDVHGELAALEALLSALGYDADGRHPEGRRLVFLGDLCDRGPDSPGIFRRVRALIDAGRAQCLLGNHEINLLRETHKEGNGWFFPEALDHDRAGGRFLDCARLAEPERAGLIDFIDGLPLVLEREDLRLVHASWHAPSIERLRGIGTISVIALYDASEARIFDEADHTEFAEAAEEEEQALEPYLSNPQTPPPMLLNLALRDEHYQNGNPVRTISSGTERIAREPFFSTGKWRMLERVRWWDEYPDETAVVFGHYWRVPADMERPATKGIHDVFAGHTPTEWLGPRRNAMCVDYSVGARYLERRDGATCFQTRLAALRWPEAVLVMDDGSRAETRPGVGSI